MRLVRRMLDGLRAHLAEWLYILLDSYVRPTAQILRVLLLYLALVMAPFVAQHALLMSVLGTLRDLLVTFFVGLGAWRAAPISRLLLSSAAEQAGPADQPDDGPAFLRISSARWSRRLPALRCWTAWACRWPGC